MNGAVFSISRQDKRSTDRDSDLLTTDAVHPNVAPLVESVDLVDSHGFTCVNPSGISIEDADIVEGISGGGTSRIPVRHRVSASIPCRGLAASARQRLLEMMLNRDVVNFTPGHSDATLFSWRPGLSGSDLYGNDITILGDATRNHVWDDLTTEMGVLRKFSSAERVVKTPFGAGYVGEHSFENEALPAGYAYPRATDFGWTAPGGSPPSLTFQAAGFGHIDCMSSVRVVGVASGSNWVKMNLSSVVADLSTDMVSVGVEIKGSLPPGSSIYIRDDDGIAERLFFDDFSYDFGDWTVVWVTSQKTWAAASSEEPSVYIYFDSDTDQRPADFEIGPTVVNVEPDSRRQFWPNWTPAGSARASDGVEVEAQFPTSFSLHYGIYVPDWLDSSWGVMSQPSMYCGLIEPSVHSINSGKLTVATANIGSGKLTASMVLYDDGAGATNVLSGAFDYTPGAAHVISIVSTPTAKYMYVDGSVVGSLTDASDQAVNIEPNNIRISRSSYGSWPLVPIGVRLDLAEHSQREVCGIANSIRAQAAAGAVVRFRGRRFRIRSIPSTPMGGFGDELHFSGNLEIEQVFYDQDLEDITSKEDF